VTSWIAKAVAVHSYALAHTLVASDYSLVKELTNKQPSTTFVAKRCDCLRQSFVFTFANQSRLGRRNTIVVFFVVNRVVEDFFVFV
jgi:hypothetical protein